MNVISSTDDQPTNWKSNQSNHYTAASKSNGGRLKQEALASGRHWLGGRNGPEQNRAASAIPKARHSPQRHPWARIRNRETPARFTPTGLPLGRQSRCCLAPSSPLKAKVEGWDRKLWQAAGIGWADVTALSSTVRHQPFHRHVTAPSVSTHPKQKTPARSKPNGLL